MAKLKQLLSGNKAKMVVNLKEIFGDALPDDTEFRHAVGQAIIDRIRERTADNIDRNGKRFKNYSDEYADSIEFKAYNKDKGDPNLKQTGEMLGLMDIVEEDSNTITIGWTDDKDAAKAHGHITGHVGVVRDFLGLPDKDLAALEDEFSGQVFSNNPNPSTTSIQNFLTGQAPIQNSQSFGSILNQLFGDDNGES